eukprot:TRINITY_DN3495_c0_g1_i1.p1 TRINITY_DN3495_c0_g1~~TRINITY_DN3495_c0_g1_i1.p1  ORF type:complete len:210 (+),score=60.61 TRINITY_DN3495_c0_g1_i1:56-685(+)
MRSMRVFVCVFFVAVVAVSQTHALYFLLEEGQQQCFMEELAEGIPAIVEFQLSHEAQATGIDVEILGPDDGPVALSKGNDGSIAFTSTMGGDYTICFHSRSTSWFGSVTNLKVIFNIKTNEDAIDYDEIAKADHLDSIEVSIRRLHDKIRGIRHEQEYMKSREIEFHAVGESTNNRVFYFSTLQVLILIGTAFFQLHHLKRYLKEQKVI